MDVGRDVEAVHLHLPTSLGAALHTGQWIKITGSIRGPSLDQAGQQTSATAAHMDVDAVHVMDGDSWKPVHAGQGSMQHGDHGAHAAVQGREGQQHTAHRAGHQANRKLSGREVTLS